MSGGYFDYQQHRIMAIAEAIDVLIANNDSPALDEQDHSVDLHFPPEVIVKFREASLTLKRAYVMAQRIDWLVSGDDDVVSFLKRWNEELAKLNDE